MDYAKFTQELFQKLQQAVLNGRYAAYCDEAALKNEAAAVTAVLARNDLTASRTVIFCKDTKGGRIEAAIIVDGVTDAERIQRLEDEHYLLESRNGLMDALGDMELQVYLDLDTDWPETYYASGQPDEQGLRWAAMFSESF